MKKTIMWEKYENYVNQNLNISKMLMTGKFIKPTNIEESGDHVLKNNFKYEKGEGEEDEDEDEDEDEKQFLMAFPVTQDLLNSIKLSSNFECWMGHTDFDITHGTLEKLDKVRGVELLKVITRYRFMVGIGKAFTFTEVRKNIEEAIVYDKNN